MFIQVNYFVVNTRLVDFKNELTIAPVAEKDTKNRHSSAFIRLWLKMFSTSDSFRKKGARCKKYKGATINNIKLTYLMQFSICQLLVLDHDYSYWLDNDYNYFTVLLGELAVD